MRTLIALAEGPAIPTAQQQSFGLRCRRCRQGNVLYALVAAGLLLELHLSCSFAASNSGLGSHHWHAEIRPHGGAIGRQASPTWSWWGGCSRRVEVRRRGLPLPEALSWAGALLEEMPERVATLGPLGPLYFCATAAVAEILTFPITPMLITSGLLFGLPLGCAAMLLSSSCAASVHFLLSRTILRPKIQEMVAANSTFQSVNKAVEREGFKLMFLIRLEPLLPSSLANFAFGLSSVAYKDFILATMLGYAPYTIALVSSATTARSAFGDGGDQPWYFYVAGAVLYIGLLKLIADVASKAIQAAIEDNEASAVAPDARGLPPFGLGPFSPSGVSKESSQLRAPIFARTSS